MEGMKAGLGLAGLAALALIAGCGGKRGILDDRTTLNIPLNPKATHDIYHTLFPSTTDATKFRDRMSRSPAVLRGMVERVYTAPEWNEELRKIAEGQGVAGLGPAEFKLHKGARFTITVPQDPKLSQTYQVGPDGYIDFPHLGRIYVDGLTVSQFKAMMTSRLQDIIRRPEVVVNYEAALPGGFIRAAELGYIYVFGAVGGGGGTGSVDIGRGLRVMRHGYSGRESLLDLIANMGGLDERGGWDQVVVYRRLESRKVMAIISDMDLYIKGPDLSQDFPLQAQDIVYVPLQYPYTDEKIKSFVRYWLDWATLGFLTDDTVGEFEDRTRDKRGRGRR